MSEPGTAAWRQAEASRLLAFGRGAALPDGGFGWLGADGAVDETEPCPLYINARMTHVFALAHLQGVPGADSLAASGLGAFASRYADDTNGGWFASVDISGQVIDSAKANYAHAHVLLAASSAAAAGIPGAEAFLAAAAVTGDPVWPARAASIAARLIDANARADSWRIPEHYDAQWRPLLDYNIDHPTDQFRPYGTPPGHSFEWARLLLDLEAAQAAPLPWLAEAATALFDTAVADAEDRDGHPGLIYTVDEHGQPVVTARLHWVACEAVLAADALHRRTGEERFAAAAARWWAQIDRYFLDRQGGGWWQELGPDMTPATTMWPGKPDLYHS